MARASLRRAQAWPAALAARLAAIAHPTTPADWYREEWRAGRLDAWLYGDLALILTCLVRRPDEAPELVIVAAVATPATPPLLPEVLPLLEQMARGHGARSVRLHTNRPGLVCAACGHGYDQREVVLAKEI